MPDIGAREAFAGKAVAPFFDRPKISFVTAALDAVGPFAGEGGAVPRHSGWQHAVEHINASRDEFHHLCWGAEAHGVPRFIRRQEGFGEFDSLHHFVFRLADTDATNGVTIKIHLHEGPGALLAHISVVSALNNSEDVLA